MRLPRNSGVGEAEFRQGGSRSVAAAKSSVPCISPRRDRGRIEVDASSWRRSCSGTGRLPAQAGPAARIDALELLRWPGVIRDGTRDFAPMIAAPTALLADALAELAHFRDSEGGRSAMLWSSAVRTDRIAARVTDRLPEVRARMRAKLLERIAQLVADRGPRRLEQELAILAQRLDVDEEIDRLRGHVTEVRKTFVGQSLPGGAWIS